MSHVANINLEVTSLDTLKKACKRLGLEFRENQRTYQWYGHWVGDYPLPQGFRKEDLGHCDHAIRVPGASYEIGVVEKNGKPTLLWDFWHQGGLEAVLGKGGSRLREAYAVETAIEQAEDKGYAWQEVTNDQGEIEIHMEVGNG